jgi:drug/metabolite transporter (DMT)-like permease
MSSSRENLGLLLGFVAVVIFGGTFPATRIAVAVLDPWFVTAARVGFSGLGAALLLGALRRPLPPRADWPALAVVALCLVIAFPVLTAFAMVTVPAAHAGIVLGILPLATVATAALLAGERPSAGFWLLGTCGAALVIVYAVRNGGAGELAAGDLLLIGATAVNAIGYTLSARLSLRMPAWEVISWALAISLPIFGPATLLLWPSDAATVSATAWASVFYVALLPQFLAFFAWNAGLAIGGIARVSQIQLLQTFVTVALAAWINAEPVDLETVLFAAAVVGTVMLGRRMRVAR